MKGYSYNSKLSVYNEPLHFKSAFDGDEFIPVHVCPGCSEGRHLVAPNFPSDTILASRDHLLPSQQGPRQQESLSFHEWRYQLFCSE